MSICTKVGCSGLTLNKCVKKTEVDSDKQAGVQIDVADRAVRSSTDQMILVII